MRYETDRQSHASELGAAMLGGALLGALVVFAVQYAIRRAERARDGARPGKMDELIVNRRYEPRPTVRLTANDDPWEHYEEVLG
ncbi:MAG TPA: hypothetical protein VGF56_14220 [Rhizomicrobium sp.]|jgi:hypothetical protein